jgi:hypothetical protein
MRFKARNGICNTHMKRKTDASLNSDPVYGESTPHVVGAIIREKGSVQ